MASNSEGSNSGVDPHLPSLGTQVLDLNDQFEQQQSAINELKEGLQKNKQQISGKEKELEEYASKLNSIRSRTRASNHSPRPGAASSRGSAMSPVSLPGTLPEAVEPNLVPQKDTDKLTPSKSLLLLRQKVNENKLILEQRGREQTESKRGVAVMLEQLKTQLEERDSTIQLLQTKLSSPDASGRLHHGSGSSVDAARKHLNLNEQINNHQNEAEEETTVTHNRKITELHEKVNELQGVIVGLQENLLEKDSVINARTKAIALMSEDLCRKGKTTLDQLEETKKEMRLMQNNFILLEADMNKEKADLCEQIAARDQRLHQLEDSNNELSTIRNELTARISELQASQPKPVEDTHALAEANKQIVKLKAQNKKQLKLINVLKESANAKTVAETEPGPATEPVPAMEPVPALKDSNIERMSIERIEKLQSELKDKLKNVNELIVDINACENSSSENKDSQLEVLLNTAAKFRSSELELTMEKIVDEMMLIQNSLVKPKSTQNLTNESQDLNTHAPDENEKKLHIQTVMASEQESVSSKIDTQGFETEMQSPSTASDKTAESVNKGYDDIPSDSLESSTAENLKAAYINNTSVALAEVLALRTFQNEAEVKIQQLTEDVEEKEKIIVNLKASIKTELEALVTKNDSQMEKIKKLSINLKGKNIQLNELQAEVKQLKTCISKNEKTISELRDEKEDLMKTLQKMKMTNKEAATQWKGDVLALKNSIKDHENREQAARLDIDKISLELVEANNKVASVTGQLSSQQEQLDQLKSVLQDREGYIQTLLEERERRDSEFRLSMNTIQGQSADYLAKISKLEDQISDSKNALTIASEEKCKIEGELMVSRMEISEKEGRLLAELGAKDAKLKEQQAVLEDMELKYTAMKEKSERVENDLYERTEYEQKLKVDNSKLQELTMESQLIVQESNNVRYSLEQQLTAADDEITVLRLKLSEQEGIASENKEVIGELNDKILKLQRLLTTAQQKLDDLVAENIRLASVEQDFILTSGKLVSAESELKRTTGIFTHDNNILIEELEKAGLDLEAMCKRNDESNAIRRELEIKVDKLAEDKELLEQECKEVKQAASQQEEITKELMLQCSSLESEKASLKKELDKLYQENIKLEDLTKELTLKCNSLTEDKKQLQNEIEGLNLAFIKLEELTNEQMVQCNSLMADKTSLQDEVHELSQLAEKQRVLSKELIIHCDLLTKDKASLLSTIDELNEEVCKKETESVITSAHTEVLQTEADRSDPEWGWGTDDAILEENYQKITSNSVLTLESELSKLEAQNLSLSEELKNSQTLGGKLVKKIKELKSQNSTLLAQINTNSTSLDHTIELEYSSQINSLEKDVASLKSEKEQLLSENHKLSTKLEGLLWQQSELQEDKSRLSAELEWTSKILVEKDQKLSDINLINEKKVDTAEKETLTELGDVEPSQAEELTDSTERFSRSAMEAELERMTGQQEDLKHELEAREVEIGNIKESLNFAHKQLETYSELTLANQDLKLNLSNQKDANDKLSNALIEQEKNLLEVNSRYLARDREANEMVSELEVKNSKIESLSQELKEHLKVIDLLKAVHNNGQEAEEAPAPVQPAVAIERRLGREGENKELDHALYRLHQKEVRCDELTIELMQLLEERDTLQLRLSVSLRNNEEMKKSLNQQGTPEVNRTQADPATEASTTSKPEQGVLANKLDQLRSVGLEQRHMALQQQQRGDVALDANYKPREQEPEQESFFQWIWGRGTPKVMDI